MFKTKTAAKWLKSVKKNAFVGILKKPRRMFKKPGLSVPVSLPAEALKKRKIRELELERAKAQALEYVRRSQMR